MGRCDPGDQIFLKNQSFKTYVCVGLIITKHSVRNDEACAHIRFEVILNTLIFEQNLIPWISRGALVLPTHGQGVPPFINTKKWVKFSKEKVCFDLEVMGFLLPYDLGVMNNFFNGVKGWRHLTK
jgi:hypothetical protein